MVYKACGKGRKARDETKNKTWEGLSHNMEVSEPQGKADKKERQPHELEVSEASKCLSKILVFLYA
jgi:hypothetical protein